MSDTVQIGDRRMSYEMQPLGANGQPINGGNHYANANTLDAAREYAHRVAGTTFGWAPGAPHVSAVSISGRMVEFYGPAWRTVRDGDPCFYHEVIYPS